MLFRSGQLAAQQRVQLRDGQADVEVEQVLALDLVLAQMTQFSGSVPADIPVTIAWGTKDRLLPQRQVLVAKAALPQARFLPLRGAGHVPMTDDPALVADVLLQGSSRRVESHAS